MTDLPLPPPPLPANAPEISGSPWLLEGGVMPELPESLPDVQLPDVDVPVVDDAPLPIAPDAPSLHL